MASPEAGGYLQFTPESKHWYYATNTLMIIICMGTCKHVFATKQLYSNPNWMAVYPYDGLKNIMLYDLYSSLLQYYFTNVSNTYHHCLNTSNYVTYGSQSYLYWTLRKRTTAIFTFIYGLGAAWAAALFHRI